MTCNLCYASIADGTPMITLHVTIAGESAGRFTGVVWHPECAPEHREHLLAEAATVLRHRAAAAPAGCALEEAS